MYAELHCHSAYSFLDGASLPAELAAAAAGHGYSALALTDHDGVWGSMEFAHACRGVGLRAISGAELTVELPPSGQASAEERADAPECERAHVTLLVQDAEGWHNLCLLITEAHRETRDGPGRSQLPPSLPFVQLERRTEGLICLSGCARQGVVAGRWEDPRLAEGLAGRLAAAFGPERFRVELQRPLWRRDRARNRWLAALAERLGVPAVATGGVHAHDASRARLQDALMAVSERRTLDETETQRRGNRSGTMATPELVAARFADHPEAVAEAARLAERLEFDLTRDLGYRYPGCDDPGADRRLAELCRSRLERRYARRSRREEAARRLEEELGLIRGLSLSGFFLLHHDLLELASEVAAEVRGTDSVRALLPPGRGRGSSVSSIVCYLTGLSHIDPVENELFLGRFLNEDLDQMPDIDLDFPRDIREKLFPRVHERYGHERSALVAAYATYRMRGAIRDLGKALGLPPGEIERVARAVGTYDSSSEAREDIGRVLGDRAGQPRWRALAELLPEIAGLPRHLSQHSGGMVISTHPLDRMCPVQPAAMEGRQLVQWDKDSCADAGFLKIDLLGLGMLSAVERCVEEIARSRGERIDLSRIPYDDRACWEAIQRAETTGVFQIESRAQMQMLPRTLPESLDDLTVQVALVRPGPIQSGAVHPYIERRKRLREDPSYEVPYEHSSLEPVLGDTLGAIVFQDQVLEVVIALAGFAPGEAEGLRRAMSRKRSEAAIMRYRDRFIEGAVARGVERRVAERVFGQIEGFSGFGFPKSHSAAFGLLAYQSTWLRVHYGPELLCALLNEQPMGFYPPDALVHEAQRRGIEVLGPDVNRSGAECKVEPSTGKEPAVRIGLGYVKGVVEEEVAELVTERERAGPYRGLGELAARSGAGRPTLERLAWSGACDALASASSRRSALWRLGAAATGRRQRDGSQLALPLEPPSAPSLPQLGDWERMVADYRSTGMTLDEHPMSLLRREIGVEAADSRSLERLPDGETLEVAGLVVARQRPATANGVVFMLLEDEWGTINLVVPPPVAERCRLAVRTAGFVRAKGTLEKREETISVLIGDVERLERPDLPPATVKRIEPPVPAETGRTQETTDELAERRAARQRIAADLAAALPAAHSFGRRGR
jgi:error-prone DNA polymerase